MSYYPCDSACPRNVRSWQARLFARMSCSDRCLPRNIGDHRGILIPCSLACLMHSLRRSCVALVPSRFHAPPAPASAQPAVAAAPDQKHHPSPQRPDQAAPQTMVLGQTVHAIKARVLGPTPTYSPSQVRCSQSNSRESQDHQLLLAHSLLYASGIFTRHLLCCCPCRAWNIVGERVWDPVCCTQATSADTPIVHSVHNIHRYNGRHAGTVNFLHRGSDGGRCCYADGPQVQGRSQHMPDQLHQPHHRARYAS